MLGWYFERVSTTRIRQLVNAPRTKVYNALIEADAIVQWMVPDGMTGHVHGFESHEGGNFRISLTYEDPNATGKSSAHTDTYHGRFTELVPNEKVVEVVEFESADPGMQGEMTITFTLSDAPGGKTELSAVHDRLPPALSAADNEVGWRSSFAKLAALLEPT